MSFRADSGYFWKNREVCTASKLMQMWLEGDIYGGDQSDMASGAGLAVSSATAPSDTDAVWVDTNLSLVRKWDGSAWVPVSGAVILTNKSGGQVVAGDVVVASSGSDLAFTTTTNAGDSKVIGVAAQTIANDASGIIYTHGKRAVNIVDSGNVSGIWIRTHTVAKQATIAPGAPSTGQFGIVVGVNTSGLRQCVLFGQATRN